MNTTLEVNPWEVIEADTTQKDPCYPLQLAAVFFFNPEGLGKYIILSYYFHHIVIFNNCNFISSFNLFHTLNKGLWRYIVHSVRDTNNITSKWRATNGFQSMKYVGQ